MNISAALVPNHILMKGNTLNINHSKYQYRSGPQYNLNDNWFYQYINY